MAQADERAIHHRMEGKVALICGATGGIGSSVARALSAQGARVALGYHLQRAKAEDLAGELGPDRHIAVLLPLTDGDAIIECVDTVRACYGRLDVLVNAAGATRAIPHEDLAALTDEIFDDMFVKNVRGPFALVRAAAGLMMESGPGVIINVSSISAFMGVGANLAYCASKAALDSMSQMLARALAPKLRVITVSPGAVPTDFVSDRDHSFYEALADQVPLKRVTEVSDVTSVILAAIHDMEACTGIVIPVDGGRHLVR